MSAATAAMDLPETMRFEQSQSKVVGTHGGFVNMLRDNAPRVAGVLKLAATLVIGLTFDPMLISFAVFGTVAQLISIIYGSKSNQQQQLKEHAQAKDSVPEKKSWLGNLKKTFHPKQYPVEANAGFSAIAEIFETGYGVKGFLAAPVAGVAATGFTPIILGMIGLWSYLHVLLGKEKKQDPSTHETTESLHFAQSESKPVGAVGHIKHFFKGNPVLTSFLVLTAICLGGVVGGIIEQKATGYIIGLSIAAVSNLLQALLVRKHDFNIEGAKDDVQNPGQAANMPSGASSFQERIEEKRKDDPGIQLA